MIIFRNKLHFCVASILHSSLVSGLERRGMFPLKQFQEQTLKECSGGKNVFVNSCTGSGKTLAYLLPIMNNFYQSSINNIQKQRRKALILTLNKQLMNQVYIEAKMLDIDNKLNILKTGTLTQLKELTQNPQNSLQNGLTSTIKWDKTDILISTPQNYMNYLNIFKGEKQQKMNPSFMVVDEADLLLQLDKNVSRNTDKVIDHVYKHSKKQQKIQFMLATSSFPFKYKGEEAMQKLKSRFRPLTIIQGVNNHKLPQTLDLFYIELQGNEEQKLEEEKKYFINKLLTDRKDQRIIIFCKQKTSILMLQEFILQYFSQNVSVLYAQLRTEQRANSLRQFSSGQTRIMICSDLASRGLDFPLPVDCIVEYNMAENIVNFINRAGRTARNNLPGQGTSHIIKVITFVQPKNKEFFSHLQSLQSQNDHFDQLFSRKRSYSKLYKSNRQST